MLCFAAIKKEFIVTKKMKIASFFRVGIPLRKGGWGIDLARLFLTSSCFFKKAMKFFIALNFQKT